MSYNLPIEELVEVMRNAIKSGYAFAWGADVSETGFIRGTNAVCVVPVDGEEGTKVTTQPGQEKEITQEMRQEAYDNWETTDDHGMMIYGIATDQTGKEFYLVKNSWGTGSGRNGMWYASEAYLAYKTMNILVHKDALPKSIKKKLDIK
jgi:aminopeptidase C